MCFRDCWPTALWFDQPNLFVFSNQRLECLWLPRGRLNCSCSLDLLLLLFIGIALPLNPLGQCCCSLFTEAAHGKPLKCHRLKSSTATMSHELVLFVQPPLIHTFFTAWCDAHIFCFCSHILHRHAQIETRCFLSLSLLTFIWQCTTYSWARSWPQG